MVENPLFYSMDGATLGKTCLRFYLHRPCARAVEITNRE
jgi:hypothetical protein